MTEADKFLQIWLQCFVILVFNRLHNVRCITFLTFNSVDHVIPRTSEEDLEIMSLFPNRLNLFLYMLSKFEVYNCSE